jgi:hypothetical protein
MKIFKYNTFSIVLENILLRQIEEKRYEARKKSDPYLIAIPNALGFSLDVSIIEKEDYFLVTRDKRHGERTALSIPQHDSDGNVFCSSAIILAEKTMLVKGEIIVRSDDFSDGALVEPFRIEYVPNLDEG